jgi:hypothetical protein
MAVLGIPPSFVDKFIEVAVVHASQKGGSPCCIVNEVLGRLWTALYIDVLFVTMQEGRCLVLVSKENSNLLILLFIPHM